MTLGYKFIIAGTQFQNEATQATLGKTNLLFDFSYLPTQWLAVEISPLALFESGAQQNISTNPSDQNNRITLKKAVAAFRFVKGLSLDLGVHDLQETHQKLLFEARSFPGARGTYSYELNSSQSLGVFVESLVPTSSSLSANTNELEPTPGFDAAGVLFTTNYNSRSRHRLQVNYFQYRNLPTSTAQLSSLQGNSVRVIGENQSAFLYNYQGAEAVLSTNWIITKELDFGGQALYLKNTAAPEHSDASLVGLNGTYHLNRKSSVGLGGFAFQIGGDAAVAAFANRSFGYTNRNGYCVEANYELTRPSVKVVGGMIQSDSIVESISQSKETSYYLRVEIANVAL